MSDSDFEDLSNHLPNEELISQLKQKTHSLKQKTTENQQLIQTLIQQKQQNNKLVKIINEREASIKMISENVFVLSKKTLDIDNQRVELNGRLIQIQVDNKRQRERLLNQNQYILSQLQTLLAQNNDLKNELKKQFQQSLQKQNSSKEQIRLLEQQFNKQKQLSLKSIQIVQTLKHQKYDLDKSFHELLFKINIQAAIFKDQLQMQKNNRNKFEQQIDNLLKQIQTSQTNRLLSEKTVQDLQKKLANQKEKQDNLANQALLFEELANQIKNQEETLKLQFNLRTQALKKKIVQLQNKITKISKDLENESVKLVELYRKNKQNQTEVYGLRQSNLSWKQNYQKLEEHCIQIQERLTAKDKQQKLQKQYSQQLQKQLKYSREECQLMQKQKQSNQKSFQNKYREFQEQIKLKQSSILSTQQMDEYKSLSELLKSMERQNKEIIRDYKDQISQKVFQIESLQENVCIVKETNIMLEKQIQEKIKIITTLELKCQIIGKQLQTIRKRQSQEQKQVISKLQKKVTQLSSMVQLLQVQKNNLKAELKIKKQQVQESGKRQLVLQKEYDEIISELINQNNRMKK